MVRGREGLLAVSHCTEKDDRLVIAGCYDCQPVTPVLARLRC